MAEPNTWQALLDAFTEQARRRAAIDGAPAPGSPPHPGATPAELAAAEQRLGRALDPAHRALLATADGWDRFADGAALLGTAELGAGPRHDDAAAVLADFFAESEGRYPAALGIDPDPAVHTPVGDSAEDGYNGHLYLTPDGAAFELRARRPLLHPGLDALLRHRLREYTERVDRLMWGPEHGPWGHDVHLDPPPVDRIIAVMTALGRIADPEAPVQAGPPATAERLNRLERALGVSLRPEHRAVLLAADGLRYPGGQVLSVPEIRESALVAQHSAAGDGRKRAPRARISRVPTVPFALAGIALLGVDVRDGRVHDLLAGEPVAGPAGERDGTVLGHLLTECEGLWLAAGRPPLHTLCVPL
ncbi:hypothetical protein [Nocardia harenae]|uniref:hypothetical protein n=1 Tax=Nocardia harenae TaxID=358707 RepID=UPI00082A7894|nr:hypothetical protein [Nocardia harenae]